MKRRLPIERVLPTAEALRDELSSVCDRIEIAGSLRRERSTIGDIELVAIPKLFPPEERDLFGNPVGKPSYRINQAIDEANAALSRPKCKADCAFCKGSGEPCVWGPWLTVARQLSGHTDRPLPRDAAGRMGSDLRHPNRSP